MGFSKLSPVAWIFWTWHHLGMRVWTWDSADCRWNGEFLVFWPIQHFRRPGLLDWSSNSMQQPISYSGTIQSFHPPTPKRAGNSIPFHGFFPSIGAICWEKPIKVMLVEGGLISPCQLADWSFSPLDFDFPIPFPWFMTNFLEFLHSEPFENRSKLQILTKWSRKTSYFDLQQRIRPALDRHLMFQAFRRRLARCRDPVAGAVIEEASIAAGRQWLVLVVAIVPWHRWRLAILATPNGPGFLKRGNIWHQTMAWNGEID